MATRIGSNRNTALRLVWLLVLVVVGTSIVVSYHFTSALTRHRGQHTISSLTNAFARNSARATRPSGAFVVHQEGEASRGDDVQPGSWLPDWLSFSSAGRRVDAAAGLGSSCLAGSLDRSATNGAHTADGRRSPGVRRRLEIRDDDKSFAALSWGYARQDFGPLLKREPGDAAVGSGAGGSPLVPPARPSSSFSCVGAHNNVSAWRTRSCHFRNVCYSKVDRRWLYYSGVVRSPHLPASPSSTSSSTSSHHINVLFHTFPTMTTHSFWTEYDAVIGLPIDVDGERGHGQATGSDNATRELLSFTDSEHAFSSSTSALTSAASSATLRRSLRPGVGAVHGFVSTTTEPQPHARGLLEIHPIAHDWAPDVVDGFAPRGSEGGVAWHRQLHQLYTLLVPPSQSKPGHTKDQEQIKTVRTTASPSSASPATAVDAVCGIGAVGSLLWDLGASLHVAKSQHGLLTPCDVGDTRDGCPWHDVDATKDENGDSSQQLGFTSTLLLATPTTGDPGMNAASAAAISRLIADPTCERLRHLIIPATRIVAAADLLGDNPSVSPSADGGGSTNDGKAGVVCFEHLQAGGYTSHLDPDAASPSRRDAGHPQPPASPPEGHPRAASTSAATDNGNSARDRPAPAHYNDCAADDIECRTRAVYAAIRAETNKMPASDPDPIYSTASQYHSFPATFSTANDGKEELLWDYRNSVLLRAGLDPLLSPRKHAFTLVRDCHSACEASADAGSIGRGAVCGRIVDGQIEHVEAWLHEEFPTVDVRILDLCRGGEGASAWVESLPCLLETTVLLVPHGPLAQATVPFLPINAVATVVDHPVPSPFSKEQAGSRAGIVNDGGLANGVPAQSTGDGGEVTSGDFAALELESDGKTSGGAQGGASTADTDGVHLTSVDVDPVDPAVDFRPGLTPYRSVSPDGILLNHLAHVKKLQYQMRTSADFEVVRGCSGGGESGRAAAGAPASDAPPTSPSELYLANHLRAEWEASASPLDWRSCTAASLRKHKVLALFEAALLWWAIQDDGGHASTSEVDRRASHQEAGAGTDADAQQASDAGTFAVTDVGSLYHRASRFGEPRP